VECPSLPALIDKPIRSFTSEGLAIMNGNPALGREKGYFGSWFIQLLRKTADWPKGAL